MNKKQDMVGQLYSIPEALKILVGKSPEQQISWAYSEVMLYGRNFKRNHSSFWPISLHPIE